MGVAGPGSQGRTLTHETREALATREIRTRRPLPPGRGAGELEATTWPTTLRVGSVMSRSPVTIRSDAAINGAAAIMRARKLRHLPVTNRGGRLVGIVTDRDLRQVIFDPAIHASGS